MVLAVLAVYTPFISLNSTVPMVLFIVLRLLLNRLVHILNATVVEARLSRCRMVPMPVLVPITRSVVARCRLRIATPFLTLV